MWAGQHLFIHVHNLYPVMKKVVKSSSHGGAAVHYMAVVPSGGGCNKLSLGDSFRAPLATYLLPKSTASILNHGESVKGGAKKCNLNIS